MERLLKLRDAVQDAAQLSFAFRTNDKKFETRFKSWLDKYRQQGVKISHMWTFANYSGAVKEDEKSRLTVYASNGEKKATCVSPCMSMAVCWDGTITACCGDFNGDKLQIGHAQKENLAKIWTGKKREIILESFGKGKCMPICKECSGYQPDTIFADPCFKGIQPNQPLPADFFLF
jgi:hypothetical protein